MPKLILAAAVAAFALGPGVAGAAPAADAPQATRGPAHILLAARKNSVIPANCTIDPFKNVYVCSRRAHKSRRRHANPAGPVRRLESRRD